MTARLKVLLTCVLLALSLSGGSQQPSLGAQTSIGTVNDLPDFFKAVIIASDVDKDIKVIVIRTQTPVQFFTFWSQNFHPTSIPFRPCSALQCCDIDTMFKGGLHD